MYGQLRTAEYCAPWIKESFNIPQNSRINIFSKEFDCHHFYIGSEECTFQVDYFLHFKDFNIYVNTKGDPDFLEAKPIPVSQDYIDRVLAIYNPIKYERMSHEEERFLNNGIKNTYVTMFYSIASALRLKRENEIETGVPYDLCFVHRYDAINGPTIESFRNKLTGSNFLPLNLFVPSDPLRWKWENWRLGPNDMFFGGDNLAVEMVMADISRLYSSENQIMLGDEIGGPNIILGRAAANAGIGLHTDHGIIPAVVRHSADLANNPVFSSWQYHQQFWLSNHKSTEL